MTARWLAAVVVIAIAGLTACGSSQPADAPSADLGRELAGKVDADGMYGHLRKFQEIADANDGNRAEGTPGYDASLDYVAGALRDRGFDVQIPEVERLSGTEGGNPMLTVAGRAFPVDQASLLVTTAAGGLSAITLRPQKAPGCTASDYGAVSVKGAIAIVDDKACSIVDKHNAAVAKGAVGLLVVSSPGTSGTPAGLFTTGYYQQLKMPAAVIDNRADAALRRTNAPVRLVLDSKPVMAKVRSVVAQTKTGDTHNVVLAGAHLDSVPAGPGINDNGSGAAALLETAAALGAQPRITNAVRFAFWGAEENGIEGSTKYVRGLDREQLADIALYLNFDMLGSPNAGYFTYDGDQSAQPSTEVPPNAVPVGSAGIERTLAGYLNLSGARPADMPLGKTSDYYPFLTAGVPVGGLTAGAAQRKTEVQARLWGGRAGVAFDPNYHRRGDTIDNVDRKSLALMGPAVAFAVGTYAQSIDGVNGVPPRDQRHRSTP